MRSIARPLVRRHMPQRITHRLQQACGDRMRICGPWLDAEGQLLAFALRDMQSAEQPVEDADRVAEVLVEVNGIGGVMDLVMGRAEEKLAPKASKRDPDVGVVQVADGV